MVPSDMYTSFGLVNRDANPKLKNRNPKTPNTFFLIVILFNWLRRLATFRLLKPSSVNL
jgi:hypothetical protein